MYGLPLSTAINKPLFKKAVFEKFNHGVATRDINKAVKNNPRKFPTGCCFELDAKEKRELVENFHRFDSLKHSTVMPKAFSEKGLYMLATILKSDIATDATLAIIETFAKVRTLKRELWGTAQGNRQETPKQQDAAFWRSAFRYCHVRAGNIGNGVIA